MKDTRSQARQKVCLVSVSGGIGSGKSTVCEMLRELGARIFNADAVARELMESDDRLRAEIVGAFGRNSYVADGSLNRPYLASRVFANEENRQTMNRVVHPHVARAFEREANEAARDGATMLVHESALITEVRNRDQFDAIVIVESPLSQRIDRVVARDGAADESVAARIRLQPSPEEFRRVADYIIVNDGSIAQLRRSVEEVFASLAGRGDTNNTHGQCSDRR